MKTDNTNHDREVELFSLMSSAFLGCDYGQKIDTFFKQNPINWPRFKGLLEFHELTPFAYAVFRDFAKDLPTDFVDFLKEAYYKSIMRGQHFLKEFLRIYSLFERKGIPIVPIKGIALLGQVYAQNPSRPMSDIDLLIEEKNLNEADALFSQLGYKKESYGLREEYWREGQYHITYYNQKKKEMPAVELHWSLDYKREWGNSFPEAWQRLIKIKVDENEIEILSPEDTLFCLALHNRRFGRTLSLKNVFDLALLLNKHRDNFNWDYVIRQARKYRLRAAVFYILTQLEFFSKQIPQGVIKALDFPKYKKKMIKRFIGKNTFSLIEDKNLFMKAYFMLFDSFREPIENILNIPQEQFAKFYGFDAYDKKTVFLYNLRYLYMPFKMLIRIVSEIIRPQKKSLNFAYVGRK